MRLSTFATSFFVWVTLLVPFLTYAQGNPGGGVPGDPGGTPIDGGLSLLVAAGVGYGAKKLYDKRKKGNSADISEKEM